MKHTNIFSRWICLVMLLASVGVSWGQTTWTKLTAGGNLASGNYQIQDGNLSVSSSIIVENGRTVTIDLNGYVLSGKDIDCVINVQAGGTLTIQDSNPTLSHGGQLNKDAYYILSWVGANGNKPFYGGTIYNGYVDANTNRKGIEVSGTCLIERANIMGCYSTTNGAAVNVNADGVFKMAGGEISYNCALQNGGGIYSQGSLEIKNSTIQYNKAMGQDDDANFKITGGLGGGVFARGESCIINECRIEYNYASVFGGGIYSAIGTTIKDSFIRYNRAMHSEDSQNNLQEKWNVGRGGGFCFVGSNDENATPNNCILESTEVSHNACFYYGGGGHIANKNVTLTMRNSQLNENEAVLHGAGGLHVTASASFKFESGEISKNVAHSVGGGIHSSYDCKLSLEGGTISGNTAHHRGGGVHVNTGGELTLAGEYLSIINNEVLNGPAYEFSTVQFNSDGSVSWTDPTSSTPDTPYPDAGYGGGVLIDAGTCTMKAGVLSGNKAKVGGGGLALVMINTDVNNKTNLMSLKVVQFTLEDGTILNNQTEGDGAGVYLMRNKINEAESKPNDETINADEETKAKWVELSNGTPKATIKGGTLSGNVAGKHGGALLVNGDVIMEDGTFTDNKAENGGGVGIIGGTVNITKGTITENEATNYGGGIYVENTDPEAVITLEGEGVFEKNTALAGGGMAVNGPFIFNFAGTIQNNNAVNGGGIYLLKGTGGSGAAKGATLNFKGGFIRNNTATGTSKLTDKTAYQKDVGAVTGVGGGVFMADYTTLTFNVNNTLGFYGNRATNAADDIFANGNGTSVTLPAVKDMTLTDFSVPAGELFWVEDYYSHYENETYESDANYADGTNGLTTELDPNHNLRYQFALQNLKRNHITKVNADKFNASYTGKYVCLALGYQIFYVTIKKTGLQKDESAFFHISSTKTDANIPDPYITMLLTGIEGGGDVEKRVALPEGTWKVTENTAWSWSYNSTGSTEITQEVKTDKIEFSFSNTKKDNTTTGLHDEDIQVNEMGKKE